MAVKTYTKVQKQGISEGNPGLMEYGYGLYVNAFVVDTELVGPGINGEMGMYATERVPFNADQERIAKARKLARQRARRRYAAEKR